tara:strand:+ start:1816 stop:2079 length:264 start_codon:yes stop_codon:yes gene_type:complete
MITVLTNTSAVAHSNPSVGGSQTAPTTEEESTVATSTIGTIDTQVVDLADVDRAGLNNNDVLVFDANTGKFKPLDIAVINDNDGGVF